MEGSTLNFHSYGGWTLTTYNSLNEAAEYGAWAALSYETRIRVVKVYIYCPQDASHEYFVGYTDSEKIPPTGRQVRDGDCKVVVDTYLDIHYK